MSKFLNPFVHTLENATNSYKYYWVLGVLHKVFIEKQSEIIIEDVFLEMLVESWQTICQFKLHYGFYDQLPLLIGVIREDLQIDDRLKKHDLRKKLYAQKDCESVQNALKHLIKYVPYRFLSSWFPRKLTKLHDTKMHKTLAALAKDDRDVFYCFLGTDRIQVKPVWVTYINDTYPLIRGFVIGKLNFYLQKRNPNVPAILSKIQGVEKRDLSKAKRIWSYYLQSHEFSCIYSGQQYTAANFSLDHFIPWSFVVHDELWNIVPTPKYINSQKNDQLPAEAYIDIFITTQFELFHFVSEKGEEAEKLLVDYINIFNMDIITIAKLDYDDFKKILENIIGPMFQIAKNIGFKGGWMYSSSSDAVEPQTFLA